MPKYIKKTISTILVVAFFFTNTDIAFALSATSRFNPIATVEQTEDENYRTVEYSPSRQAPLEGFRESASGRYLNGVAKEVAGLNLSPRGLAEFLAREARRANLTWPVPITSQLPTPNSQLQTQSPASALRATAGKRASASGMVPESAEEMIREANFARQRRGILERGGILKARMMDEIGVKEGDRGLFIGSGDDETHPLTYALRGGYADIVQPPIYQGYNQTERLRRRISRARKRIEKEYGIDLIKGHINTKSYQDYIENVKLPAKYYSHAFLLIILDDDNMDPDEKIKIIRKILPSLKDKASIFISAWSRAADRMNALLAQVVRGGDTPERQAMASYLSGVPEERLQAQIELLKSVGREMGYDIRENRRFYEETAVYELEVTRLKSGPVSTSGVGSESKKEIEARLARLDSIRNKKAEELVDGDKDYIVEIAKYFDYFPDSVSKETQNRWFIIHADTCYILSLIELNALDVHDAPEFSMILLEEAFGPYFAHELHHIVDYMVDTKDIAPDQTDYCNEADRIVKDNKGWRCIMEWKRLSSQPPAFIESTIALLIKHIEEVSRHRAELTGYVNGHSQDIGKRLLDKYSAYTKKSEVESGLLLVQLNELRQDISQGSERHAVDVAGTIKSALKRFETLINIAADIDEELPAIYGSKTKLFYVWLNLLNNSRDAIWEARDKVEEAGAKVDGNIMIGAHLKQSDGQSFIEVVFSDNGIGIPEELLKDRRLFQKGKTTKEYGTGLGLYLIEKTIEEFGGTIEAANRPEGGAVFTIRLPIAGSDQLHLVGVKGSARASASGILFSANGVSKPTITSIFENHKELHEWLEGNGLKNETVINLDAHHDLNSGPFSESTWASHSIRKGTIGRYYQFYPAWLNEADLRIHQAGKVVLPKLESNNLEELPEGELIVPVILSIDFDYFACKKPEHLPSTDELRTEIRKIIEILASKKIRIKALFLVTSPNTVPAGYTELIVEEIKRQLMRDAGEPVSEPESEHERAPAPQPFNKEQRPRDGAPEEEARGSASGMLAYPKNAAEEKALSDLTRALDDEFGIWGYEEVERLVTDLKQQLATLLFNQAGRKTDRLALELIIYRFSSEIFKELIVRIFDDRVNSLKELSEIKKLLGKIGGHDWDEHTRLYETELQSKKEKYRKGELSLKDFSLSELIYIASLSRENTQLLIEILKRLSSGDRDKAEAFISQLNMVEGKISRLCRWDLMHRFPGACGIRLFRGVSSEEADRYLLDKKPEVRNMNFTQILSYTRTFAVSFDDDIGPAVICAEIPFGSITSTSWVVFLGEQIYEPEVKVAGSIKILDMYFDDSEADQAVLGQVKRYYNKELAAMPRILSAVTFKDFRSALAEDKLHTTRASAPRPSEKNKGLGMEPPRQTRGSASGSESESGVSALEEYLRSKYEVIELAAPIPVSLDEEVARKVREGTAILKFFVPQDIRLKEVGKMLTDVATVISVAVIRDFPIDTVFPIRELFNNAFYHGNKFDRSLPIFIHINTAMKEIDVYDLAKKIEDKDAFDAMRRKAHDAKLGGNYLGLVSIQFEGWRFPIGPRESIMDTAGRTIGTKATIFEPQYPSPYRESASGDVSLEINSPEAERFIKPFEATIGTLYSGHYKLLDSIKGRSGIINLIGTQVIESVPVSAIKLKGIVYKDEKTGVIGAPVMEPYYGIGNPGTVSGVDKNGRLALIPTDERPVGTMLLSRARHEVEMAYKMLLVGLPVNYPIGVGELPDMLFNGNPVGFAIFGLRDKDDKRLGNGMLQKMSQAERAKILALLGRALRDMHDKGFIHTSPHLNNFGYHNGMIIINDLDRVIEAAPLSQEERIAWRFVDLRHVTATLSGMPDDFAMIDFLRGYFYDLKPYDTRLTSITALDFNRIMEDARTKYGGDLRTASDTLYQLLRVASRPSPEVFRASTSGTGEEADELAARAKRIWDGEPPVWGENFTPEVYRYFQPYSLPYVRKLVTRFDLTQEDINRMELPENVERKAQIVIDAIFNLARIQDKEIEARLRKLVIGVADRNKPYIREVMDPIADDILRGNNPVVIGAVSSILMAAAQMIYDLRVFEGKNDLSRVSASPLIKTPEELFFILEHLKLADEYIYRVKLAEVVYEILRGDTNEALRWFGDRDSEIRRIFSERSEKLAQALAELAFSPKPKVASCAREAAAKLSDENAGLKEQYELILSQMAIEDARHVSEMFHELGQLYEGVMHGLGFLRFRLAPLVTEDDPMLKTLTDSEGKWKAAYETARPLPKAAANIRFKESSAVTLVEIDEYIDVRNAFLDSLRHSVNELIPEMLSLEFPKEIKNPDTADRVLFKHMKISAEAILAIINDYLGAVSDKEAVDVGELVWVKTNIYRILKQEELLERVPSLHRAMINRGALWIVLGNLFKNAHESQRGEVDVSVGTYEKDGYLYITVADNGGGIPEDILDRVFEPDVSSKYPGRGLGLTISKRLIESAGGTITVASEVGKGTTFTIRLPVVDKTETVETTTTSDSGEVRSSASGNAAEKDVERGTWNEERGTNDERRYATELLDTLKIRALEAKKRNEILLIALETNGWIPSEQRGMIEPLLSELGRLGEHLERLGLDNVRIIKGKGDGLADAIDAVKGVNPKNIVVLASEETLRSTRFDGLRSTENEERAFLAGIDPKNIEGFNYIRLLEMLTIAVKLASGEAVAAEAHPNILIESVGIRIIRLIPKAEPIDSTELPERYKAEKAALLAA